MEKEAQVGNKGEDFAVMLEESLKKSDSKIVKGTIVEFQNEGKALIDVGEKQEGIVSVEELKDGEGNLKYNIGDKIDILVFGFRNERPLISHKKAVRKIKTKEFIEENKDNFENVIVNGKIVGKNKGGYIVEQNNVAFFMPNSQAYFKKDKNVIGKKIFAKIIKIDEENFSIVISRKKYIEDEKKRKTEIIQNALNKNEPIEGIVKKITNYGMFVEVA